MHGQKRLLVRTVPARMNAWIEGGSHLLERGGIVGEPAGWSRASAPKGEAQIAEPLGHRAPRHLGYAERLPHGNEC